MIHTSNYTFDGGEILDILSEQGLVFPPECHVTIVMLSDGTERLRLPLDNAQCIIQIDVPSKAVEVMSIPMYRLPAG